ncbi:MAG: TetR/AcrR family transcriptional regulator [Tissierellales bacterium]|jgi:AcrR family transcriptional regulator|nr:TetR/AcrR family transcriptional regulator [Tissierellales bacterium]HCX04490.1 hypothetical protein [Clostridiales bacterium]
MKKMSVKERRTFQYFIDAAKEIIEEDGVQGVTARKVGKLAGYSYATIYNYFSDIKELLAYCAVDYLKMVLDKIEALDVEGLDCLDTIKLYNETYFRFFAEKPQLFQLIFLEDIGDYPIKMMEEDNEPQAGHLIIKHLVKCAEEGLIDKNMIETIHRLNTASIHGKLLFYIKNRDNTPLEDLIEIMNKEIDMIF